MKFYEILMDEGKRKKYAYGILLEGYPMEQISCQDCGRNWKKHMLSLKAPKLNMILTNDNFPDFLRLATVTLVSKNAKKLLKESQILESPLQRVNSVKKDEISKERLRAFNSEGYNANKFSNCESDYYYLDVEAGAELHSKSEVILKDYCSRCGYSDYVTIGKTYVDPFHV